MAQLSAGAPGGAGRGRSDRAAWHRWQHRLATARDAAVIRVDPTYRRLARSYEFPDGSRRVYAHHLRKTAGSSLFHSFLALGGEDPVTVWRRIAADPRQRTVSGPYGFAFGHREVLAEGAWYFARSHRPWPELALPPRTFTVTVLRDPVARVHSFYDYLVSGDAPGTPFPVADWQRRWAAAGFDAFLDRVPDAHLVTQLHTFSPRQDPGEAADRIASCSFVFFTEAYADGLAELGRRLDVPLAVHRARTGGPRSTLSDRQVDRLRERLAPEYEMLARLAAGGIVPPRPEHPTAD